nr:ATP-binding protein [Ectobacillus ponti]
MILLISVLVFHLFWVHKGRQHPRLSAAFFLALASLSIVVCITFAVQTYPGYRFDLRHISLIFSTLIGGPAAGGAVWALMNLYRFLVGGDGALPALFASSVSYLALLFMYKPFIQGQFRRKLLLCAIASALFPIGWAPFFLWNVPDPQDYFWHVSFYQFCSTAGTLLILYLIEILRSQVRLQEEFVNMEKFHLIGEMAASISHEVRNPLTSTRGFLQLLQTGQHSPEERSLYLDIAINGIDQANHVLTDYLTFAKPSIDKTQRLDVQAELFSVLSLITPLAHFSNIVVQYEPPGQPLYVLGEKQKFNQCILNILKNCIEAMPSGGTLTISASEQDDSVQLLIEDTGTGMSKEQLQRLGSPFYSTKEKGTGLGMMVVFSIVKAMSGNVKITSQQGDGSCFRLSFPRVH